MSDLIKLMPREVIKACETMIENGSTGSLTFHFNRGMVQKIERTEYQVVTAQR